MSAPTDPELRAVHVIPADTAFGRLECRDAVAGLTDRQKRYLLELTRADWAGAKITLLQSSPESADIFTTLHLAFSSRPIPEIVAAALELGLTEADVGAVMVYAAAVFCNLGNYRSFGHTKFVPDVPAQVMALFLGCAADHALPTIMRSWDRCRLMMYRLDPSDRQTGLVADGGRTSYLGSCTREDAEIVGRFLAREGLSAYNTRLSRSGGVLVVHVASVVEGLLACQEFEGRHISVKFGDYSALLKRVVGHLDAAIQHATPQQAKALERYRRSFVFGDHAAHVDGSAAWVEDRSPAVESYMGFIESYADPVGQRGEWEGFVACVNPERGRQFTELASRADVLLPRLPWPRALERPTIHIPDFTSLDVVAFGSSGVPAGINIPNYPDVREDVGYKNVALTNVIQAGDRASESRIPQFVCAADARLKRELGLAAFDVCVGIHELLGHGSGRLVMADAADGVRGTPHPLTGRPIDGPFYQPGETYQSVFGDVASSYEECRAEAAALVLSFEPEALEPFGFAAGAGANADAVADATYIVWLDMMLSGLRGMQMYRPDAGRWGQAHSQARYCLLRVALDAGVVGVAEVVGADGGPDLLLTMPRDALAGAGRAAMRRFILELQTHRSLADPAGIEMYRRWSEVPAEMLRLRDVVMARKRPRSMLVQPHVCEVDGTVEVVDFEPSARGLIESFVARYPDRDPELVRRE